MINARFTRNDEGYQKDIDDLQPYFKSFAKDFDCEDWVQKDPDLQQYFFTQKKEFEIHEVIDEYDNDTFWDELPMRLARRDLEINHTTEELKNMSDDERMKKLYDREEVYQDEFEENGLKNLRLPL